ncbi:MAG: WYL domain-containing protein [Prevotella sp.]|nr:WYL domain-containing protein [Bacteroides sp.]MCM1366972.1 WYL domain-containing protein [Prevotella sp.]MCM1437481.1 WYL domain-containing protein [Prevotella sp.]
MNGSLLNKYVWIVDTIMRYGRISRAELNRLWLLSSLSDGIPIPARTFFHYRRAIEENFHIDIKCTPSKEYYIEQATSPRERAFTNWMLNSLSTTSALGDSDNAAAGKIIIEEIPSAREFLPSVIEAIKNNNIVSFTYAGFNRSRHEKNVRFAPWFIRLYKQRWYMIGLREKGEAIRTYALDRIRDLTITKDSFTPPDNLDPEEFFANIVGITVSKAPVRTIKLKTDTTQAKYFRALPLHTSQKEEIGDGYSIFTYSLKLNYELVHEILALGPQVKVLEPRELQVMVMDELKKTLDLYN